MAVFPSLFYENAPAVILKSFRAGTPVIGSHTSGIPEIVEDSYNGRLFEAGNSDELKDMRESLIGNPTELKRLGEGAAQSVKKYDINTHVSKLVTVYKDLIDSARN